MLTAMSVRSPVRRLAGWVFGPTLSSQYLPALRARGRAVPYDAKRSWATRYERVILEGTLDDASTIKRGSSSLRARYHYNSVENAILEHALRRGFPERPATLDIGTGAGHWIDFYRDVLGAGRVVGVEISSSAAIALTGAYAGDPTVSIVDADVADASFELGEQFGVVNAVDVLFHIVDDGLWRQAVRNLAAHLEPGGRLVVAEHVGVVTHNAGFRHPDPERGEGPAPDRRTVLVTKRVRSLRAWRACAREAGLTEVDTSRIRKSRSLPAPANRLLVFGRRPSTS
jgi:SAM-dependent methyltransferase